MHRYVYMLAENFNKILGHSTIPPECYARLHLAAIEGAKSPNSITPRAITVFLGIVQEIKGIFLICTAPHLSRTALARLKAVAWDHVEALKHNIWTGRCDEKS